VVGATGARSPAGPSAETWASWARTPDSTSAAAMEGFYRDRDRACYRRPMRWLVVLACAALACGGGAGDPDALGDAGPTADADVGAVGAAVFDPGVLHTVALEVAPEHLATLEDSVDVRVPATLTFDGDRGPGRAAQEGREQPAPARRQAGLHRSS
jgi:hypothetical protein